MVVRRLLFLLLNSPHLIQKLSESRPIRAAARIAVAAITRGQLGARQAARDLGPRLMRLRDAFREELKDGARQRGWQRPPGRGPGRGGRPGAAP